MLVTMPPVLTHRALNRATLARQMLLARERRGIVETVEWLVGLQSQQTHDPYIALWTRLEGFSHEALTALIIDKSLLRATSMRSTLHLHSVRDMVGIRALVADYLQRTWTSGFRKRFRDGDRVAIQKAGRKLLDKAPMTAGALGKALHERFPEPDPLSLTTMMQAWETLIQVPPTRIWGSGHAPLLSPIKQWLGTVPKPTIARTELVRRYLAAFGPASVADMQTWSRLTHLKREVDTLRDELVTFTDEDGRELFDLIDGPRPQPDTRAPVRFLPLFDNVYLGYDNRRRMLSEATEHLTHMVQAFTPAVLIDGMINAGWTIADSKGTATLEVKCYRKLALRERRELEAEGEAFLAFMRPEAKALDIVMTPPPDA